MSRPASSRSSAGSTSGLEGVQQVEKAYERQGGRARVHGAPDHDIRQTASGGDNWRVDRTAPAVPTITGNSPNGTNKPSVFVAISKDPKGSGVASYSYEVATQTGWGQETTGKTVTIKAEGRTSVRFRARDKAGNFSAWGQAGTWIDTVKPEAPETPIENASGVGVDITPGISIDPYPGTGVKDYQYQYGPDSAGTITYGTLTTLPSGAPSR